MRERLQAVVMMDTRSSAGEASGGNLNPQKAVQGAQGRPLPTRGQPCAEGSLLTWKEGC